MTDDHQDLKKLAKKEKKIIFAIVLFAFITAVAMVGGITWLIWR